MRGLLGDIATSWSGLLSGKNLGAEYKVWLTPLMSTLSTVLWVVLALVGAAGGIYAVYVGIKMARAESAEQRDENKKRLINIIVAIVVVIVLIFFFNVFLPMILSAVGVFGNNDLDHPEGEGGSVQAAVTAAKVLLRLPL